MSSEDSCAVCGVPASQRCANCFVARYCSRAHQKAHWNGGHKSACRPYVVSESPTLGRHLVATRDIAPGEVLIEERPLAVGPKASSSSVCLTCYAPVVNDHRCSACGWPMCGPRCEAASVHRVTECPLITGHYDPGRSAAYCFVLPLRCLLLDDRDGRRTTFQSLQSHVDQRLDTVLYRMYAVNVAAFVLDRLGLRSAADGHDERSVLEAAAVLDTNAFQVRRPGGRIFRAVYARASMMAHDCTPNTKHVFVGDERDGQPSIRVLAAVPISRGRAVTVTYTQTLWCTRDRRRHVRATKCFECSCQRCVDPTELGTHLGSTACRTCDKGYATAVDQWKCAVCGRVTDSGDGDGDIADAERRVRSLNKTECAGFERFLEQTYAGEVPSLHTDHYVTVSVKYALVQLYGDRLSDLSKKQLKNNTKICKELLRLADILEPGITRFRGLIMFYFVRSLKVLKRIKKEKKRIYDEMIDDHVKEAVTILKTEPDLAHLIDQLR